MKPLFVRFVAVLALAGCLPEGGPPAGTRLVEERHVMGARFLPGPDARLLYARRTGFREIYPGVDETRPVSQLWAMPAQGGAATRLVDGSEWELGQPVDALGRLWTWRAGTVDLTTGVQTHEIVRVDATGVQTSLSGVANLRMSPGGTRVYYSGPKKAVVRELDDRETPVEADMYSSRFVGEALVFQRKYELWVLPAGQAQPVLLAPEIDGWWENPAAFPGLQLALLTGISKPGPNGEFPPLPPRTLRLVLGPTSRELLTAVFMSAPVFAPNDDRLAIVEQVPTTKGLLLHVFHTGSDEHQTFDLGVMGMDGPGASQSLRVTFRPGTAEIWCSLPEGVRVVRPDGAVVALDEQALYWDTFRAPLDSPNLFPETAFGNNFPVGDFFGAGGQLWLYVRRTSGGIYVGRADDPGAPGLLLEHRNDAPTATFRVVPGGRRLLMTWAPEGQARHWNITLVDPDTTQRRVLATSVGLNVVGARRLLTLANESGGLFDLRLIDLDTGEDRLLAQNVTTFTTPSCGGCDPTAPGAPVAYVVHARVPFKYDGLWRVELP